MSVATTERLIFTLSAYLMLQVLYLKFSITTSILFVILAVSLVEFLAEVKQRYAKHKIFDQLNIPSIGNTNPFIGNMYHLLVENNICKLFLEYHRKFGKTIGFFYGPDPWVMTTDLELLHQVYETDFNKHVNLPNYRVPYAILESSLVGLKRNKWRKARRSLGAQLAHKQLNVDDIVKSVEDSSKSLLDSIESGGPIIDVIHCFKEHSIKVIAKTVLDRHEQINMKPGELDNLVAETLAAVENSRNPIFLLSLAFDLMKTPITFLLEFTKSGRHQKILSSFMGNSLLLRKQYISGDETHKGGSLRVNKILDTILSWAKDDMMRDLDLKANVFVLYTAGFETTAITLTSLCWLLAKHQDIQEKLRQALILEGEKTPYLGWCIKETLRLYPTVPLAPRELGENVETTSGLKLLKGMALVADTYSIHHNPEYWGQDADEFRPERFGEPFKHPNQFFAFGAGPRGCIGQHLATMNMKTTMTRVITQYRIEPCASSPKDFTWNVQKLLVMDLNGRLDLKFVKLY